MSAVFLVAIMIWHDGGDIFTKRHAIVSISSASLCESAADILREQWQREVAHATISIECVPVVRMVRA